jgi:hypothetical protein
MCNYTIYASDEAMSLIVKYLTYPLLTSDYIRSDETTLQVIMIRIIKVIFGVT